MVGDPSHTPWVMTMNGEGVASARRPPDGPLRRRIAGTDVSTIIFSSGTSGQLKALLLSRAGVEMAVTSFAAWDLAPGDGILVALPLSIFQQRLMIYAALRADCDILLSDSVNLFRSLKVLSPSVVLGPPALFETVEKRFDALPGWRYALLALLSTLCAVLPAGARARVRRHLFAEAHEAFGGRVRVLLTGSAPSKPSTLALYERAGIPLYQSYGLAEVGFIAWNRPGRNRALSVGHPVVPGSVTIAEDGEILVALDTPQAIGYYGVDPEEEQRTFLGGGRIATGDLGCFDGDGFLHITGRKKNLILLQSGEKIQSELLERRLGEVPGVECAVVVGGDPLPGLVALVAIDPSAGAEDEARVRDEVQRVVNTLNNGVKPGARIVRFIITRMPFKPKTGLVTRNLKIDRKAVVKIFEKELRA
jgi:long-subunit acyl-CoA synthetase (AMP-forming)